LDLRAGTSLAAPLVSFTAALIRSETTFAPTALKRRILASADVAPDGDDLLKKIIDGRRLNIVKALAVSFDVVEVSRQLRLGTVRFMQDNKVLKADQMVALRCQTAVSLTLRTDSILKLSRFGGSDTNPIFLVYYLKKDDQNANKVLDRAICQVPGDWSLSFLPLDSATPESVPFPTLTDFVRRSL
jgi:hypothetical protein